MNIVPKLNLNKHPKDNDNLSLVNAYHVKVSHDESCITSEESIKENVFIHNYLTNYYLSVEYKIIGVIPCNNELVILVKPENTDLDTDIFRYQEPINNNIEQIYCAYGGILSLNRFKYNGGLIKGTFTYNVENSLIIAITEYNVPNIKIPLRTINLGNSNDSTVYNDKDLSNSKLSISPEVRLPSINNLDYLSGGAYKGWYYIFIRYKINTVDYTQWYSIGTPIYIDTLEQYQIIRYCYNRDTKFTSSPLTNIVSPAFPDDGYGAGCSDYFSNNSDIAKETFKVDLYFNNKGEYNKYQIGLICSSKSYTKAFRTADIFLDSNYKVVGDQHVQQYMLDNKSLIEYNINDLITDNFNYFNSKNIINYKNRLYISNYLEDNANNDTILQSIIDNVNLDLTTTTIKDYGLVYDTALIVAEDNGGNQYDSYTNRELPLYKYLNVSEETMITIFSPSVLPKTVPAGHCYIMASNSPEFAYIQVREFSGGIVTTDYGKDPDKEEIYITLPSKEGMSDVNIIFDTSKTAMDGSMRYTNTNISFKDRKKESSLIPGEVYNLFIHYTSKYGHSTNGYKLQNKTIWDTIDNIGVEIIPIPFNINVGGIILTYYAAMSVDDNVAIIDPIMHSGYNINVANIKYYKDFNAIPRLTNKVGLLEEDLCEAAFIEHFSSYANIKFINVKWYQVSYGPSDSITPRFHLFINNNGDRLFKIPIVESFVEINDGIPNDITDFKTYNTHRLLRLAVDNVEIPEGYDGFYISYEQFEPQKRATGLLTRNDFRSQDYVSSTIRGTINTNKSSKMFFYSSIYDVSDTIKLDYNIIRIEAVNPFKKLDIPDWDYFQRNYGYGFMHDMNKPQIKSYGEGIQKTYAMPEYKISIADSAADNRMGLGTALQIVDSYNLFPSYDTTSSVNDKIKLYRATLLNTTRDIYMSNNKKLIRLNDVTYRTESLPIDQKYNININSGYNGNYTYDGLLIYENAGVSFNTTNNKVTSFMSNDEYYKTAVDVGTPHTFQNDFPFLAYLQLPICNDIFFESKSFKNAPKPIIYVVKTTPDPGARNLFAKGSMVIPVNSIDLFENRQGSSNQFNPKTYSNYREDLVSVEQFDKTVRRSNVIQDESRVNGWRTFPVEAYKNISENKGKITNLIGIGTVLLIHTEHSLFMFNTDNTLKTQDKDIQLSQPDAFEVSYNEVFTSDKGYGGLQDDKSYLVDQFGYIFYSEDTNRIYLFDNNQLDNIDDDIIQWLNKYKPFGVRMANDKRNNRILMRFDYIVNSITKTTIISYNYKVKSFTSQHLYHFDEAFNTKTGLYLQCNNTHNGCSLHNFDYTGSSYGSFDNIINTLGIPTIKPSKISIITNNSFSTIKYLEFISYKLTKYVNDVNIDFTNSPVEEYIVPFSGNNLIVYNDMINTGLLNISVDVETAKNVFGEFAKPYWDLGVWNFSYLRNNINQLPIGLSATEMSRLFGNYFICEFTFNNEDGRRVDFEELNYNISEN